MNHAMIDLETLDTKSSAHILSIGACIFTPDGPITDKFYVELGGDEQPGRTVSASTVGFWLRDTDEFIRLMHPENPITLQNALSQLQAFLTKHNVQKFWANGVMFDFAILEHAYTQLNYMRMPWGYSGVCCLRGIKALVPWEVIEDVPNVGKAHNALDDCEYQIDVLKTILQHLTCE